MPDAAREALEMIKRRATEAGGNVYGDLAEAALTQSPLPREGEWVTVKFSQEAKSRAYELVEQAAAAAGGYEVTDITILRALNAAAPPSPDMENRGDEPSSDASVSAPPAADGMVVGTARAIAQHGFGRPWADFLTVNAHDTDQGDLMEYARAAIDFAACEDHGCVQGCKRLGYDPAAESSRNDLLRQLEEAKGEVGRLKNELAHEGEHQRQCAVEWFNKFCAAEAQRDALLEWASGAYAAMGSLTEANKEAVDATMASRAAYRSLRTAHEAAAHNTGEGK